MKDAKENITIEYQQGSAFFWLAAAALILLLGIFFIKQMTYVPVNANTVKDFVLDESKEKASPIKKYFPKPYSVKDLMIN